MRTVLDGLAGLGFVVVYFAYEVMLNPPDISVSSRRTVAYWTDSGHQAQAVVGATLCGFSVLLFVGFVIGVARRLEHVGAAGASQAARLGGAVTATLLLLGGAIFAAPALALALNNEPVPTDDEVGLVIRASSFVAHPVMLWFVAFGGAVVVAAVTVGGRALGWRRWTLPVGAVLVAALVAPLVFLGPLLFLAWTAVVSTWMLRAGAPGR